jgi:hypothetical protein
MLKLNLISPEYKKTIKIKKILTDVQNLFLYVTFIVTISATILLIARIILEDNFTEVVEQTSLISRYPAKNKKNTEINKKIELAKSVQDDYIAWSRLIINFSKIVPDEIQINSFNVNPYGATNEWVLNIVGKAANRNDFLTFKENLLAAKELFEEKNIDIPITNLFEKENINFSINIKIKKEILTNLPLE